jgi:hypothetical protein
MVSVGFRVNEEAIQRLQRSANSDIGKQADQRSGRCSVEELLDPLNVARHPNLRVGLQRFAK